MGLMTKVCEYCGKEFQTTSGTKKFCDRKHTDICMVCGKEYEVPYNRLAAKDRSKTCSRKCAAILRKQTNQKVYGGNAPMCSDEVKEKVANTNIERYGVKAPMQNDDIKEKVYETNLQRYGYKTNLENPEMREKIEQTWIDKYGVNHPWKNEQIRDKIKSTLIERYGCDNPGKIPELRDKASKTYYENTGYEYPTQNPEVIDKIKQTNLEKYGAEYPYLSEDILNRMYAKNIEKYGTPYPTQTDEVKQKISDTCQERYGSNSYLTSDIGKAKIEASMQDKYNVSSFSQSEEWHKHTMLDSSKYSAFLEFKQDVRNFILTKFTSTPTLSDIAKVTGVHINTVGQYVLNNNCSDIVNYVYSQMEHEVYTMLSSYDDSMIIERNTRNVITPYELDIYLPEYQVAIECNPTSTHNSTKGIYDNDGLHYRYHKMKSDLCEKQGIFLFHIFGYDWTNRREIIESMLLNLIHKTPTTIYARKTEVREVDSITARQFLTENHRQGYANGKIRYGLYYNDELVSLMTFGKMRHTIGIDKSSLDDCYELVRFCNKINTNVVGGASKLFKYFIKHHNPTQIRSFSDKAHTRGNLYEILGFTKVRESEPGYVWVDGTTDIAYHRMNAQKSNIQKFLHDNTLDIDNLTEKQIMESHGYVRVYDCGTITWEWRK